MTQLELKNAMARPYRLSIRHPGEVGGYVVFAKDAKELAGIIETHITNGARVTVSWRLFDEASTPRVRPEHNDVRERGQCSTWNIPIETESQSPLLTGGVQSGA